MSLKIFQDSRGEPIVFYFRPCQKRSQIQPLIEANGGKVTVKCHESSSTSIIKLANDGDKLSSEDYVSATYVEDCVKYNKLLDQNKYRLPLKARRMSNEDNVSDISVEDDPCFINVLKRDFKGRKRYTEEEDQKMLEFIMDDKRYNEINGNLLWRDMEMLQITPHTSQSMRTRFLKMILPNLHHYTICDRWRSILKSKFPNIVRTPGNWTTLDSVDSDGQDEFDDFLIRSTNPEKHKSPSKNSETSEVNQSRHSTKNTPNKNMSLTFISPSKTFQTFSTPSKRYKPVICEDLQAEDSSNVENNHTNIDFQSKNKSSSHECELESRLPEVSITSSNSPNLCRPQKITNYVMDLDCGLDDELAEMATQPPLHDSTVTSSENQQKEGDEDLAFFIQEVVKVYPYLNVRDIYHLLWLNNGDVKETLYFMEYGKTKSGKPLWRANNDHNMDKKSDIEKLNLVYGKKVVQERLSFLEDSG